MREAAMLDALLILRDSGEAAITATASETAKELPVRKSDRLKVIVNIEEFDNADTNETYQITVQVSDLVGGTFETVATLLSADLKAKTAPYKFELPLSGKNIEDVLATAEFIRVTATLGGTTPSLKYNAFVAKG